MSFLNIPLTNSEAIDRLYAACPKDAFCSGHIISWQSIGLTTFIVVALGISILCFIKYSQEVRQNELD